MIDSQRTRGFEPQQRHVAVGLPQLQTAAPAMSQGQKPAVGFVPLLLDRTLLTGAIKVTSGDATLMARRLSREFGLLVGTSSGANVIAAREVARQLPAGSVVVTPLPDRADRYFSAGLFAHGAPRPNVMAC